MFTLFRQKPNAQQILAVAVLFLSALGVGMMSPSNPFSNSIPATDSAVFLSFAQAMQEGRVPYIDFFDNKGPFLFSINYFGYLAGGMRGVWCVELVFLFTAAVFAYKTTRLLFDRFVSLVAVGATYIVFSTFYCLGNLAEVYVQPLILISLYLFSRHLLGKGNLRVKEIFVTGFCFGLSLMLKPNLGAVWVAFGGALALNPLLKKEFGFVFRLAGLFLAGTAAAVLPFLIYLVAHGALGACLEQYILFNSIYAQNNQGLSSYVNNWMGTLNKVYSWSVLLVAVFWFGTRIQTKEAPFYIAYFLATLLTLALVSYSSFNFGYYNMILIPLFAPALAFFAELLLRFDTQNSSFPGNAGDRAAAPVSETRGSSVVCRRVLVVFSFALALNLPIIYGIGGIYMRIFPEKISHEHPRLEKPEVMKIAKIIQENSTVSDTITVVGNSCTIYFYSQRLSASKYLYQFPVADISEKVSSEYQSEILAKRPKFILFPPLYSGGVVDKALMLRFQKKFPDVFQLLESEYVKVDEPSAALLFKRK